MSATIERRSRAEFNALVGRRDFAPRPLSADQRVKIDKAIARKAQHDALRDARSAAAHIEIELQRRLDQERRLGGGADPGGYLLTEVKRLRGALDELEL